MVNCWVGTHVRLIICLQVINELDEKKDDSRLGNRASRTIKEIRAIRSSGGTVRKGVTLEIFNYAIRATDFPGTLSYDSKDDRIVHSVKKFIDLYPQLRVAVYTEDMGMGLRCGAHGVAVVEPDTKTRLENPQDELTKKYRQAVNDLAALKNRLPTFDLRVLPENEEFRPENKYELLKTWEPIDSEAEVAKLRTPQYKPTGAEGGIAAILARPLGDLIPNEEWECYEQDLAAYYRRYGQYVHQLNNWGDLIDRTIRLELWLANSGNTPAEDIDLHLMFPPRIRWVAEVGSKQAAMFARPDPPQPPKRPESRLLTNFSVRDRVISLSLANKSNDLSHIH
ncbi:PIN domain-containing protein [Gemmata massiliana]|uniref:PIN domain-containing protein n=1 Tax=Gemmata massiliana TaxID=1210884 RepID=UPI0021BC408B|nr:PIN domain-containing protein [Gemmata massiliana]